MLPAARVCVRMSWYSRGACAELGAPSFPLSRHPSLPPNNHPFAIHTRTPRHTTHPSAIHTRHTAPPTLPFIPHRSFGRYHLEVRATPGHTNGCVTFVMDDRSGMICVLLIFYASGRYPVHTLPTSIRLALYNQSMLSKTTWHACVLFFFVF